MNPQEEFGRQVNNLIQKDYPKMAGMSEEEFLKLVETLKQKLLSSFEKDLENGKLSFVIVIKSDLVPAEKAMTKVTREEKSGITKLYPHEPKDFQTIYAVKLPESPVYLLVDIDRGNESINVRPGDAFKTIAEQNRSPLTIDEGIAIVTHFPEFLIKNKCFSLLASRNSKDKRVPAIWINGAKHPNLGWCWEGNPHTWLGSASTKKRIS